MSDLFVRIRLASIVERVRSLRCPAFYPVFDLDYGYMLVLHSEGATAYKAGRAAYRIERKGCMRYAVRSMHPMEDGTNGRRTEREGNHG